VRFWLVCVIAVLVFSAVLAAQLKVDVQLVSVVATVMDDRGRYVPDLLAEDFVIEEDGQPQTITHFDQSSDLPVSMGVVLDTSGSMESKITTATNAVEQFLRTIHKDDDIFLLTFSGRPDLRQDFTSDRARLAASLRKVRVSGDTALYDAVDQSLRKIKRGSHQKKAILLITDGDDTSSSKTFEQTLLAVRESELLIYALGISPGASRPLHEQPPIDPTPRGGSPFPIPGMPSSRAPVRRDTVDMNVLNAFAEASGGRAWSLSGTWSEKRGNQIESALDEIASELRNQYGLAYYPSHPMKDGKWHRIEIRAKNPRYYVRARKEYFGG
jgi:Ca-activated chloride channel homolog